MSNEMSSPTITKLVAALTKAQSKIEGAKKDSSNPHFKSKYADLQSTWEACKDALIDNGFCITQLVAQEHEKTCLVTMLMHSSGEWLKSSMPVIQTKPDIQGFGSALTYCRRYSLSSILCMCAVEDDDGEKARQADDRARKYEEQKRQEQKKKEIPATCNDLCLAMGDIGYEFSIESLKDYIKLLAMKKGMEEADILKSAMIEENIHRFKDSFVAFLKKHAAEAQVAKAA